MRRAHRAFHRTIWPILAVVIGLGFVMALTLRPPPEAPPAAEQQR
jgi:hypothetical protein